MNCHTHLHTHMLTQNMILHCHCVIDMLRHELKTQVHCYNTMFLNMNNVMFL